MFEEVKYEGQETVGPRWVIIKKEKAEGQKKNVKGRLDAKGLQETEASQSDAPIMLRESMKLFFLQWQQIKNLFNCPRNSYFLYQSIHHKIFHHIILLKTLQ